ncbi:MAG: PaaI family thioesterase [Actinomycetota bacterium]|nr:PaaI family thioesterase [Actinomycetota bacterium]
MGFRLLEKGEGSTTWEWTPDERFQNPAGTVQGGLMGAFLDSVNGASLVRALGDRRLAIATIEQKTSFLRAVFPGTTLRASGKVISLGERLGFVESRATDQEGEVVATSSSTWILLPRR